MSIHDDLKAYLDGELDAARAEEMRGAIEASPELRREVQELRMLSASLRAHAVEIVPRGADQTLAALAKAQSPRYAIGFRLALGGGLALVAAALVAVVLIPSHKADLSDETPAADKAAYSAKSKPILQEAKQTRVAAKATQPHFARDSAANPQPADRTKKPDAMIANKAVAANRRRIGAPKSVESTVAPTGPVSPLNTRTFARQSKIKAATTVIAAPAKVAAVTAATTRLPEGEKVVLAFASKEEGAKRVLAMVAQYEVVVEPTLGSKAQDVRPAPTQTIAVDLPEDQADKIVADLKALPRATASKPIRAAAPMAGGFGGGSGGFGGRAAQATPRGGGSANPSSGQALATTTASSNRVTTAAAGAGGSQSAYAATSKSENGGHAKIVEAKQTGGIGGLPKATPPVPKKVKTRRVLIVIEENPKQQPVP